MFNYLFWFKKDFIKLIKNNYVSIGMVFDNI